MAPRACYTHASGMFRFGHLKGQLLLAWRTGYRARALRAEDSAGTWQQGTGSQEGDGEPEGHAGTAHAPGSLAAGPLARGSWQPHSVPSTESGPGHGKLQDEKRRRTRLGLSRTDSKKEKTFSRSTGEEEPGRDLMLAIPPPPTGLSLLCAGDSISQLPNVTKMCQANKMTSLTCRSAPWL